MHWAGVEGDYNCMVIDLLGPSLDNLFRYCGQKLTIKTAMTVGEHLVTLMEEMHNCGYLHRDVKPDNFMIGLGKK